MKDFVRSTPARIALSAAAFALTFASAAYAQAPVVPAPAPAQKAAPAPAQKAAPAAPAAAPQKAAAPAGPPPEWLKVCGKDEGSKTEMCSVTSFILDGNGNPRGQIQVVDVTVENAKKEKESKRIIQAMIPPGFLIQPGINLVIDDSKTPIPGRYRICYPNACVTEVQLADDVLANIKKGKMMQIFFANQKGEWLGAKISLAGFGAAYEGKALDPKVVEEKRKAYQENQNKLQSELAKRAEEQRKKLQDQATPAAVKTQ
jgi:invasion protein IalB